MFVWVCGLWAHCDAVLDGCPHSDVPIDFLAYMAENRPVFRCRSIQTQCWGDSPRLTHKHTHRCLHLNTYKCESTIVSPWFKLTACSWKYQRSRRGINLSRSSSDGISRLVCFNPEYWYDQLSGFDCCGFLELIVLKLTTANIGALFCILYLDLLCKCVNFCRIKLRL